MSSKTKATRVAFLLLVFSIGVVVEHLGDLLKHWAKDELRNLWHGGDDEDEDDAED